jgi:Arc/MetJ family transcription regulator
MRTNVDIDDQLMEEAMQNSDSKTKKGVVEEAWSLLIQTCGQASIRSLFGTVKWEGNLEESRLGRSVD